MANPVISQIDIGDGKIYEFEGGGEGTYRTSDSASTTIDDTDYIPISTSTGEKKKSLWSNIKSILSNVFASKSDSIKNITRSGTTFTATRADNTTFTFDQQDSNTTTGTTYAYSALPNNTTFGTNGSIKNVFDSLNSWRKYIPVTQGDWRNAVNGYMSWYYYEGAGTNYGLPQPNMIVLVCKQSNARGLALAMVWNDGQIQGAMYVNGLHGTWRGWTQIR